MTRRHALLTAVLTAIAVVALGWAAIVSRQQERTAIALAAVPRVPAVEHWPASLAEELHRATAAALQARDPAGPLAHLAGLYLVNEKRAEAAQVLDGLERLEPDNARWPYLRADLQLRSGDEPGAIASLQAALRLAPGYAPGWIRLGDLQWRRHDGAAAQQSYREAVRAAPQDPRAQFALARLEAEAGTLGDPRRRLVSLARAHPEIGDVHELLARVLAAAAEPEMAAEERKLRARSDRRVDTRDAWLDELAPLIFDPGRLGAMARQWVAEQRLAEAAGLLDRAVQLAPGNASLRRDLAAVASRRGRPTEARVALEAGVAACPNDPELVEHLAAALGVEHKPAAAIAVVRRALTRWPARAGLHAALGFALRDAGENDAAAVELREAVRLDPTRPETHYALAFCLLAARRPAAARIEAEQAVALRPDYAEALVMLGGMAIESGEIATAERVATQLHELQPNEPGSRLLFAGLQLIKGRAAEQKADLEEADRLYRAGLAVSPDFTPLLREAGLLSVRRAQFEQAVEMFDRYLRIEPRDLEAYVWLGDALVEAGRDAEARNVFERGLVGAQKAHDRPRITDFSTRLDR